MLRLARYLLAAILSFSLAHALAIVEIDQPAPPLKGKVVLVNFYSSYCRSCAIEIGTIETYRDDMKDRGFDVIVIGVDRPDDKARVARMLGIYNLQGAMAAELDETGFERSYPTPTAFVIDREGVVRAKLWGVKTMPRMRELMTPYLGK